MELCHYSNFPRLKYENEMGVHRKLLGIESYQAFRKVNAEKNRFV